MVGLLVWMVVAAGTLLVNPVPARLLVLDVAGNSVAVAVVDVAPAVAAPAVALVVWSAVVGTGHMD